MIQFVCNGFRILGKSWCYFLRHLGLLVFPVIGLLLNIGFLILILYFIYGKYGIHIFREESHYLFDQISLGEKIYVGAFLFVGFYFITTFTTAFTSIGFTDRALNLFENRKTNICKNLKLCIQKFPEVLDCSLVGTFFLAFKIVSFEVKNLFRQFGNWWLGDQILPYHPEELRMLRFYYLVIPIIVKENLSIRASLKRSYELMAATFGSKSRVRYSYFGVILIPYLFFVVCIHYTFGNMLNSALRTTLYVELFVIVMAIIEVAFMLFKCSVYHLTIKLPTGPFSEQFIRSVRSE